MAKSLKKYLGLALLANFVFALIGILSHREQELSEAFYRVIGIGEGREGISSDLMLIIDGQQVTIKQLGQEDRQVIDPERQVIRLSDKDYYYNYNSGHLSLVRKTGEKRFERI